MFMSLFPTPFDHFVTKSCTHLSANTDSDEDSTVDCDSDGMNEQSHVILVINSH